MLVWLDGRLNTRQRPQENFGREIMELFTFGVGNYTEQDVYAAARVFTGWNLRLIGRRRRPRTRTTSSFSTPTNHDPSGEDVHVPDLSDGSNTIPARAAADGMQDGIDFITALATHPADGATAGPKDVELLRERSRAARRGHDRRCSEPSTCRSGTQHRIARALHAALASVPEPGQLAHALSAGQSSTSCARSRRLAGPASRSTTCARR